MIVKMLIILGLCHTVVVEKKGEQKFYNSSSPDELALVNAAKYFGYIFKGRNDDNGIELLINGQEVVY